MDDDIPDDVCLADLKNRQLGGWGLAQIAAGTGLAVYAVWVGILQPGFRKVPLKLQVWSKLRISVCYLFIYFSSRNIISLFSNLLKIIQVPYIPASKAQVDNVMKLLSGQKGGLVDLGSGDGRIVSPAFNLDSLSCTD